MIQTGNTSRRRKLQQQGRVITSCTWVSTLDLATEFKTYGLFSLYNCTYCSSLASTREMAGGSSAIFTVGIHSFTTMQCLLHSTRNWVCENLLQSVI